MSKFLSSKHSLVFHKFNFLDQEMSDNDFQSFLVGFLNNYFYDASYILNMHNLELNEKTHIHCILITTSRKHTDTIISNYIAYSIDTLKLFNDDEVLNDVCNSIELSVSDKQVNNLSKAVRYLCHLDEKDKLKYPIDDVIYNDEELYLKLFEEGKLTSEDFIKRVVSANSLVDIINDLGLDTTKQYFWLIKELRKDI